MPTQCLLTRGRNVMARRCVSFPFAQSLTKPGTWDQVETKRGLYRVLRFHFLFDEHLVQGPPRMGERLGVHYAVDAESVELINSINVELATVDFEDSFRESVLTNEMIEEVSDAIKLTISPWKVGSISGETRNSIKDRVLKSVRASSKLEHSVTETRRYNFEVKYRITDGNKVNKANVAMYEEHAVDVYLVWVDFLDVDYGKSMLGMRKKRIKKPAFDSSQKRHANEAELNLPVGSFRYWQPLPFSSVMVPESEYRSEVEDSSQISRAEISQPKLHERRDYDRVPSLYQLSNVAFPLRWIDRETELSREELLALEFEEARDSIWWFQDGPGRSARPSVRKR